MNEREKKVLFEEALYKLGFVNRMVVCMEELGELQQQLGKVMRTDVKHDLGHLAEELADVELCCEMIRYYLQIDASTDKWKEQKLDRLQKRLRGE